MSKPTWKMTGTELARVVAEHLGLVGRPGGWLYDGTTGRRVCQGYAALAAALRRDGIIAEGSGVTWRRVDQLGGATKVTARIREVGAR